MAAETEAVGKTEEEASIMSITVTTAASTRLLCSVTDVLDEMSEDVLLVERFVAQASAAIERYCGMIFAQQRYTEILASERQTLMGLTRTPIVSLSSVTLDGEAVTDYRIEDAEAGLLYRRERWGGWGGWTAYDWTFIYVAGYLLPGQIPIDATGSTLPGDIQRACIEATKIWWQEKEISGRVASKTLGLTGDRIEYRVSADKESLPPLAKNLLKPWRRLAIA